LCEADRLLPQRPFVISKLAIEEPQINSWVRAASLLWLYLKRPFLLPRARRLVLESVLGSPMLVWPDVFNPVVFRSSAYFAEIIGSFPRSAGRRALDMGTGSGVCGIFAAKLGYRVTAVDLNPEAVRCAKINCLLNSVDALMEVRHGDLFDPVCGERFDLIMFNPPFFRGEPKNLFDMAWRSRDVLERFAAGLPEMLLDGGQALILISTDGDGASLLTTLQTKGFLLEVAGRKNFGNEIVTVYSARLGTS
jgi:release factor glutamine methyltransferase